MTVSVSEMTAEEFWLRISYFHSASDDHLRLLGVDRAKLPDPHAWYESYLRDLNRPLDQRETFALIWQADRTVVGFSTVDRITFGAEAFMHLHVLDAENRNRGLGTQLVQLSAARYFDTLDLAVLYCEPNAFNVAPNRTLQSAGFRYLFTHECTPGPLNFPQPVTRWQLTRQN